jgi:hypothetical protein
MARDPNAQFRFPPQRLAPSLRKSPDLGAADGGPGFSRWEVRFDFGGVPAGEDVDLLIEYKSAGHFLRPRGNSVTVELNVRTEVAELTVWILMPRGQEYTDFRVTRYEVAKPKDSQPVNPVTRYMASDSSLLAFKLLSLDAGYNYEVSWNYK